MAHILIIDDDLVLRKLMERKLSLLGHLPATAATLAEGLRMVMAQPFDLVLLDVHLPDGLGLEAIPHIRATRSQPEIIIITAQGDPDGAELAIETGAWDYLEKPLSTREITLHVTRVLEYRQEKTTCPPTPLLNTEGLVGSDTRLKACLQRVSQVAVTDAPVLITGETGTGKELFARAVHSNSRRSTGPFVVLDCAVFPEKLVESMLFGHRKGAFTGADRARDGLILQAHKGTLFMDEVGELPLTIQKTFLRVLQERRFRAIGGNRELVSDFRLVAATNRDLEAMVTDGLLRKDLLFRLKAASIHLPPLKARRTDIETLARHYINAFCHRYGMQSKKVSPECLAALQAYTWPGNVRELVNTMESAITNARDHEVLYPMHLPVALRVNLKRQAIRRGSEPAFSSATLPAEPDELPSLKASLEKTEMRYLQDLMHRTSGEIQEACRVAGLSRSGLYARLKKYQIRRPT